MIPTLIQFHVTGLDAGEVDAENGVIKGVSVITSKVTARGHNLEVDDTTLSQMKELGDQKGQVPVKWNHKTGADAVNGYLTNFRVVGHKLKADWHLLKAHGMFDQALELATRMPKNVGLSASFMGKNEKKEGKEFARCSELISVDLVATPAANPDGLFEVPHVDTPGSGMADNIPAPGAEKPTDLAAILAAIHGLKKSTEERFTAFDARFAALEEREEEEDDDDDDEEEEEGEAEDGADFSSMADVLKFFEARVEAAEDEQERREFEGAFAALEGRVEGLVELNEQLAAENEVMAFAIQELQAKSKTVVQLSAGADGTPKISLVSSDGRQLTEFEARVAELRKGGKDYGAALIEAQGEDANRYHRHLQTKGALAQELGH